MRVIQEREMRLQDYLKTFIAVFFTAVVFLNASGCGNKQDGELTSGKDTHVNNEDITVNKKSPELNDDEESMLLSSLNQIDLDKWEQLVEELKNTLGDMEEIKVRAEQVSKTR